MPADPAILRVYDPAECDEHGVPLDWERCRTCDGEGRSRCRICLATDCGCVLGRPLDQRDGPCTTCGGHGSLKAAALVALFNGHDEASTVCERPVPCDCGPWRCEDCGHPQSKGTWEGPSAEHPQTPSIATSNASRVLRAGFEPPADGWGTHYSPCDEGCRHGGPVRCDSASELTTQWDTLLPDVDGDVVRAVLAGGSVKVESSWRQVDVRTLGWAHDLRPERLAVLCLRCYAELTRGR